MRPSCGSRVGGVESDQLHGRDRLPGLIVLVGGESTGKSTLGRALTVTLPALDVPEVLRDWVAAHGRVPNQHEQRDVMNAQAAREVDAMESARSTGARWVISDGGALMTAVYSSLYYGDDSLLPEALRLCSGAALIVWCDDDIPWVADEGQRDGPGWRAAAQRIIGGVLRGSVLPWIKVTGDVDARAAAVKEALGERFGPG